MKEGVNRRHVTVTQYYRRKGFVDFMIVKNLSERLLTLIAPVPQPPEIRISLGGTAFSRPSSLSTETKSSAGTAHKHSQYPEDSEV
ncbi:hypothetical protein MJO29_005655 [Puccinia striiformis f. sp. tritici]|nr:hypothetical protein MJO29_005655 [Puccinia striiformis f. sp. tritici]